MKIITDFRYNAQKYYIYKKGDKLMKVCILEHDNFRSFTEKRFQVVQVTKSGLVLHVYDTLCETLDRCKAKIAEHGDELDKIGNIYQISK